MLYKHILKKSISARYPWKVLSNGYYAVRSLPVTTTPFKLKFENTTVCNLKCKMCPLSVGLKRPVGSLSYENFKFVFDQIYPCYLNLTGIGEPLANRDIFKIIKYSKDKTTFVKNTKNFIRLRNETKKFKTEIHSFIVVQKDNFHELPDYIKLANELGFDSINGTFVIRLGENENDETGLDHITSKDAKKVYERTKKVLKDVRVPLRMGNLFEYLQNFDKEQGPGRNKGHNIDKPCFLPWYTPYITWDGNVCPCDFYAENEIVFGNVFEEPFMKIWNNEKAQAFRKQLIKERIGICATCGVNEEVLYNKFKFVKKIPVLKNITERR